MTRRSRGTLVVLAITSTLLPGALAAPAAAKTVRPPLTGLAWYWEPQTVQEVQDPQGNTVTLELPNPFCPAPPGSLGDIQATCAEGRLPVEVHAGDYDTPDKISAVAFDLSAVPVGSTVERFTVSFLEAKSGCEQTGNEPPDSPVRCEVTDPINVEGHQIEACRIDEIFGEGPAKPNRFQPRFECTGEAIGERKQIEYERADGTTEERFVWEFDLTSFARDWTQEFSVATGIMLYPIEPEQTGPQDTWRVVLTGPRPERGIVTKLVFTPPAPPPQTTGPTGGSTGGSSFTSSSGSFSGFGSGSVGTTTTTTTTSSGSGSEAPAPAAPTPAAAENPGEQAVATGRPVQELPAYMWLALLAGLIAFSAVRSVVLERHGGIRPDGVLAQIRRLNAERRGLSGASLAAEQGSGVLDPVLAGLRRLGRGVTGLAARLPFVNRGR